MESRSLDLKHDITFNFSTFVSITGNTLIFLFWNGSLEVFFFYYFVLVNHLTTHSENKLTTFATHNDMLAATRQKDQQV